MKKVITTSGKECLTAGCRNEGKETLSALECPYCGENFCAECFLPVHGGDGTTIKCPHCKEVIVLS